MADDLLHAQHRRFTFLEQQTAGTDQFSSSVPISIGIGTVTCFCVYRHFLV